MLKKEVFIQQELQLLKGTSSISPDPLTKDQRVIKLVEMILDELRDLDRRLQHIETKGR
jgi:hypothetical protein